MYVPMQTDLLLIKQKQKTIYSKIEILDKNFNIINRIEGQMISDSFTTDSSSSSSPNRRIYNVELYVANSSFTVGKDKTFWFDRYIRPYIGIYSLRDNEIKWYLKGTFIFNESSFSYNVSKNSINLTCPDLMALLNGDVGGRMDGLNFSIDKGQDIRTSIIGILNYFGSSKYRIDIPSTSVPYDLEFNFNATAFEMIEKLMEFLPSYEFFFDVEGVFIVQRRICYINDSPVLTDAILSDLIISEDYKQSFSNVRNCIQVWGHEFETDNIRYTENCIYNATSNIYTATFQELNELIDYTIFAIKIPSSNKSGCSLKINNIQTFKLITEYEKELTSELMKPDTTYVFLYKNNKVYYLGQFQIQAVYKNVMPDSPFSVQNIGREIWEIKQGGEYEDIISDANAMERAMYECYKVSNMAETLTLNLVDIPWLDVGQKVTYKLREKDIAYEWLVDNITSSTMEGIMSVTLTRFYPDWSEKYLEYMK